MKFGGQSVKRIEDDRLLTGKGRYADDIQLAGMVYGVTLRSPYGHARVAGIDTGPCRATIGMTPPIWLPCVPFHW